ncbi:UPF0415 protein C7orf25 homolog [Tribolium madens]|uniref:UPF0415 protein C7orf25 homolog n=1 Tax=Tribolium madens TaxID=41895 RepID=UPI001CF7415B|nr:UPF0415 protein C7orf25 homolog [Tribolium madens]
MGTESVKLRELVLEKISFGEELIKTIEKHNLEGIQKLKRKIHQELKFLGQVIKTGKIKKEHIQCSNLTHFSAVVNTLNKVEKCLCVNKVVMLDDRKITIDIICDDGLTWMKVIARNPKSLSQICMGDASFGVRSVLDHAEDYLECAKLNPCLFQIPKVVFVFVNGVGSNLAAKIENLGIIVQGVRIQETDIDNDEPPNLDNFKLSTPNTSHIDKVNLDVSAMLAYVSSVCNGSAHLYHFSVHVLAQQAEWERQRPQKPILDDFFKGKKLYCCETARDSFISIVNTVGGVNERKRAENLLQNITVLPDNATADNKVQLIQKLTIGGKIKARSLTIFTFGDRIGAVTVTSNDGFVRAARQQGVNFVVFIHESRALTEQKEQTRATGIRN